MREVLLLAIHLLVTLAKLLRPGGVRAVAAESLLLKHQILISDRSRQRAPNLTTLDRFVLGLTTLFVNPRRIPKLGVLVKPATLLKFHKALVDRKYRLLFSSSSHRRKPGPKGPSPESGLVDSSPGHPAGEPGRLPWITMKPLSTARPSSHRVHSPSITDKKEHLNKPYKPGPIPLRIDPLAQSLGNAGHGRVYTTPHRLRRRACRHRWRFGMSDVQSCHRRQATTETPQH